MSKSIRFTTLVMKCGPVKLATQCSNDEWQQAVSEERFCTVYHGQNDYATPLEALVAHHGCVNTICKLVFSKPLPPHITRIIGMRDNQQAFDLCNQ